MEKAYYDKKDGELFCIFGVSSREEALKYAQGSLIETPLDLPFDMYSSIDIKDVTDFLQDGEALEECGIHDQDAVEDLYNALIE